MISATALKQRIRGFLEQLPLLFPVLRELKLQWSLLRQPRPTPLGFSFSGMREMEQGVFEPDEVAIVQTLLREVDVFVNVGANYGYYVCLAGQAGKRVIAFEPLEANLRFLYQNLRGNTFAMPMEIFPLGLSDKPGLASIYGTGTGASLVKGWCGISPHFVRTIPLSTLDLVLGQRLSGKRTLILIDVEGHELAVLRGALEQLKLDPAPIWMVEICLTENQPEGIISNPHFLATFDLFFAHGYQAFTVGKELKPVFQEEIRSWPKDGSRSSGTYNVVFRKQSGNA